MDDKAILFVGIPNNLKNEYYDTIREIMGYDRKNLRIATAEAIQDWINKKKMAKDVK